MKNVDKNSNRKPTDKAQNSTLHFILVEANQIQYHPETSQQYITAHKQPYKGTVTHVDIHNHSFALSTQCLLQRVPHRNQEGNYQLVWNKVRKE